MNQKTLDLIGRSHTPEDVYKSFELARNIGFDNINTDIILGLPGEGKEELRKTVEALEKLGPDSITVHSLALKRASKLNIDSAEYKHIRSENSEEMIDMTADLAERLCMRPYYMYRQQNKPSWHRAEAVCRKVVERSAFLLLMSVAYVNPFSNNTITRIIEKILV